MSLKRFEWNKAATAAACMVIAVLSSDSRGDDGFRYFNNPEIDYWNTTKATGSRTKDATPAPAKLPASTPTVHSSGFAWEKYLNPAHDDFFKEGEYTPPAPFVEIARNPTDENLARWFQYIEKKNELLRQLQGRLTEYAQKNPGKVGTLPMPYSTGLADDPNAMAKIAARLPKPTPVTVDAKRFRLRLYFDSKCPHCEHMMGTVSELAAMGYFVEIRQVDQDRSVRARIPFPVVDASAQELKIYGIQSVPVLLIGDLKKKTYFKMEGYQAASTVLSTLGWHN